VGTPNEGAGLFILSDNIPTLAIAGGPMIRPVRTAHSAFVDAVSVGRSVWGAYTRAGNRALDLRRYDLVEETTDPPITVADTAGEPSSPKVIYTGDKIGIFWLQTVGVDRMLFGRWMTPEGEFVSHPVALSQRGSSVTGSFDVAWDGQQTAILYPTEDGLIFKRGDLQCW